MGTIDLWDNRDMRTIREVQDLGIIGDRDGNNRSRLLREQRDNKRDWEQKESGCSLIGNRR